MILVNPNNLVMKTSHVPDIAETNLYNVDVEMKRILDLPSISNHEKALMYEQALSKYLTLCLWSAVSTSYSYSFD